VPQTPAGRQAMQSLNLMLLAALVRGEVRAGELFGTAPDPTEAWRSHALLWHSQCSEEGWWSVTGTLFVLRLGDRADRDLVVVAQRGRMPQPFDPLWASRFDDGGHEPPFGWGEESRLQLAMTSSFLNDRLSGLLLHALEWLEGPLVHPLAAGLSGSFVLVESGTAVSAARALLDLWWASTAEGDTGRLVAAYEVCLAVGAAAFDPQDWWNSERFLTLLLRQADADRALLPDDLVRRLASLCRYKLVAGEIRAEPEAGLRYWAARVLGPDVLPAPPEPWREP
jgi:hypothetical protein